MSFDAIVWLFISPLSILSLLAAMALSFAVLYAIARRAFMQIGTMRIVTGYLIVLVSMIFVSVATVIGNFTFGHFAGMFLISVCMAYWVVAVFVLPLTIALTAHGRGIVGWVLLACSAVGAPALTVFSYLTSLRDIANVTAQQWTYDLLSATVAMTIISGAFSIGARLPWTKSSPRSPV